MTRNDQNLPQVYVPSNETIYGTQDSVNVKDFVIGVLVGGIIGAAAGLLLAPKSGSELRTDAATQAIRIKDKSVELSSQLKEQSTQLVEKVKKTPKSAPVLDDGTVSSEGEEPLEDFDIHVATDSPFTNDSKEEVIDDISAAARHTNM